jgi:hypothetical protein
LDPSSVAYAVAGYGNLGAGTRLAAAATLDRLQLLNPYAGKIHAGDKSTVVISSQGKQSTYQMTWLARGTALDFEGPVPAPTFSPVVLNSGVQRSIREQAKAAANLWKI